MVSQEYLVQKRRNETTTDYHRKTLYDMDSAAGGFNTNSHDNCTIFNSKAYMYRGAVDMHMLALVKLNMVIVLPIQWHVIKRTYPRPRAS